MTTASLDRPGRNGCLGVAGAIRDGDLGADGNQLIAGAASASTNTDIAAAGKLLQRASIAAAARKPGEDQDKLNSDIATAQQALLTACKTLLGDEPW
jgi:hypothetical protein